MDQPEARDAVVFTSWKYCPAPVGKRDTGTWQFSSIEVLVALLGLVTSTTV